MKLKLNIKQESIVYVLTIVFIASFTIFAEISYGRYIMLGSAVLVFLYTNSVKNGKLFLKLDLFQVHILVCALFCMLSAIWAQVSSSDAFSKGTTLISILVTFYPFYVFYNKKGDINLILKPIMWAGLLVAIYTFMYYGVSTIISLVNSGSRLPSEFANSNTIGMSVSMAIVIAFYYFLTDGISVSTILAIPGIVVVAVSGSRKAFVMLLIGIVLLYVLHSFEQKNFKGIIYILGGIIILTVAVSFLEDSQLFSNILMRMEGLIASITGSGKVDNSTKLRNEYVELGFELFKTNPLVGIGIDNAKFYTIYKHYLHNNYIELLADGGIIGIIVFYLTYLRILWSLWNNRKNGNKLDKLIWVMVLLDLMMQYGYVAYYNKLSYIYLMTYCLYINNCKRKIN